MIGNTKRTAASERTRAPHAALLLFIDSGFVPVFAHALRVGGSGCTVAVRVLRSGPCVACVVVSEIPTLAGQYGAPAPWAHHPLTGHHALRPSCALTLVRAPVASLCCGSARMVASATMLIAVAVTVGYESRAAGVGAASHMPHTPPAGLIVFAVPAVCPGARLRRAGTPTTWAGSATDAWAGAVDTRAGTTKIQEHPAGCAVLGGYLRPLIRDAQY